MLRDEVKLDLNKYEKSFFVRKKFHCNYFSRSLYSFVVSKVEVVHGACIHGEQNQAYSKSCWAECFA